MKMRSVAPMRIAKIGYIAISILLCISGILFIAVPNISGKVIGIIIGLAMIVFGIVKLVGYFSKDLFRLAFQYDLEFGILLFILGIIILLHPQNLMIFMAIAFGIAIMLDGLFKIRIAMDSKSFGIRSWGFILALAIVTGLIGAVLIFDSAVGTKVLSVLIGISLLAEGILNLYTVITTVRIVKNQMPDTIVSDAYEINEKDR